jgi:anhydro-N-acetylmuramic acid kinase
MKVLGLMSGTSADGIDAALTDITGAPPHLNARLILHTHIPFTSEQRAEIFALFEPTTGSVDRICHMNFQLGEWFAAAALQALAQADLKPTDIDLIGSHGQTIYHAVDADSPIKSTLQIGEEAVIAARTGVTTVADFRVADVAAGGQGAPLVSYVDWLLLRHESRFRSIQNIGGIANVTYLPPGDDDSAVIAFDTGPGNMLIDAAVGRVTDGEQTYDEDGAFAASGKVDRALLAALMAHPFLSQRPPKTTGREQFGMRYANELWSRAQSQGISDADLVATLTAFTSASIADAYRRFLPQMPDEVILGGGGTKNPTLLTLLRKALDPITVTTHEAVGIPDDAKEALAFAVLAYETLHGRPGNLPNCTGASRRAVLGKLTLGANYQSLVRRMRAR